MISGRRLNEDTYTVQLGAGSWSGRGDMETNSFPAASGYLRFTWETSNETKPGEGRFKLSLGSSISGFYIKVESANEDWKVTVDEGFSATIEPKR